MSIHDSDRAPVTVIKQAATVITGGLLVLAASVLFFGLMVSDSVALQIIALVNAVIFYVWGLGCLLYVFIPWKASGAKSMSRRE